MPALSLYDPLLYQERYAPHAVFYYDRIWEGYHMQPHAHPQVEIMYVVSGKCTVVCDAGGASAEYALRAGDYILIDTDVPHRLSTPDDAPCQMKNIEFAFTKATPEQMGMGQLYRSSQDLMRLIRLRAPVVTGSDAQGDLLRAFDSLLTFYLYSLEQQHAKAVADHAFAMLLLTIAYLQGQAGSGGVIYLRRALGYIQAHGAQPLPVADIAAAAGVHPVYLQRLFQSHLHMTIVEYVTGQRIDRAAYLLRHTRQPVADIASEVGFGSRQQFYRSFVAIKGVPPKSYRAKHQQ